MKNRDMHRALAKIYGNKCMFLASHCDTVHYKKYQKRYKSKELKKLIKSITVHHLKHRSEGGKTTVENCSLVNELAHRYLHYLPREQEEIINNKLREYKKCKVVLDDDIDINCELHCGFIEDGNIIEPKRLSKHEIIERERRKEKKEFEREKKEYEDR